ncbi:hypothetical protein, partial [Aeromonas sp. ZOR0002]|uniref:hypothetical protein n=1 Tax=Aeromonas sp. ZOR0002 TaxID=1339228 RepID=UPI001E47B707
MRSTRLQGCFFHQKRHCPVPTFFKTAPIIGLVFELSKIYFIGRIWPEKRLSVANGSTNPECMLRLQGGAIGGHA